MIYYFKLKMGFINFYFLKKSNLHHAAMHDILFNLFLYSLIFIYHQHSTINLKNLKLRDSTQKVNYFNLSQIFHLTFNFLTPL
jgi:hypothetical protein